MKTDNYVHRKHLQNIYLLQRVAAPPKLLSSISSPRIGKLSLIIMYDPSAAILYVVTCE